MSYTGHLVMNPGSNLQSGTGIRLLKSSSLRSHWINLSTWQQICRHYAPAGAKNSTSWSQKSADSWAYYKCRQRFQVAIHTQPRHILKASDGAQDGNQPLRSLEFRVSSQSQTSLQRPRSRCPCRRGLIFILAEPYSGRGRLPWSFGFLDPKSHQRISCVYRQHSCGFQHLHYVKTRESDPT
jgi:hypothetical protein